MTRRDSLGRRIGHNWWREYVMTAYLAAWHDVDQHREDNHQLEADEFRQAHPLPRFKDYLLDLKGTPRQP